MSDTNSWYVCNFTDESMTKLKFEKSLHWSFIVNWSSWVNKGWSKQLNELLDGVLSISLNRNMEKDWLSGLGWVRVWGQRNNDLFCFLVCMGSCFLE